MLPSFLSILSLITLGFFSWISGGITLSCVCLTSTKVSDDEGDAKEFKEDETQDAYLLKRNMLLKALDKLTVLLVLMC